MVVHDAAPQGDLGLELVVGSPNFRGGVGAQFVKTLVDGVMVALHSQDPSPELAEACRRFQACVGLQADHINRLLPSEDRSALGRCRRLLALRGAGIQCHPEDIRLGSILVSLDRSSPTWTLRGRVEQLNR